LIRAIYRLGGMFWQKALSTIGFKLFFNAEE